ncbi:DUF2934 domain-containing protein [Agrobacterium rosae]|uniref:DUF2934 domain-containing protein n=1 Tax=Agrobacterium rosae TaxID=1972867 RepID=A0AAW9FEF1_9HYPH|nr:DUF2934 domain-containing protein [Agrobacterium rosae]MDX8302038.1 DUF2934 domain-containing protein [Agrobacterium rosae]POO51063.1 hypothetical protein CTT39_22550 [Agrobacterium rosae]
MQVSSQEWISKRAYTLWESEGHPHGRDADHWEQAKHEYALLENTRATKPATRKKSDVKDLAAQEAAKPKVVARKNGKK